MRTLRRSNINNQEQEQSQFWLNLQVSGVSERGEEYWATLMGTPLDTKSRRGLPQIVVDELDGALEIAKELNPGETLELQLAEEYRLQIRRVGESAPSRTEAVKSIRAKWGV